MKKHLAIIFILSLGCTKPEMNEIDIPKECQLINITENEKSARTAILGKWLWWNTAYNFRGVQPYNETPKSTGKSLSYEFTGDNIVINTGDKKETKKFEIRNNPLVMIIKEQTGEIISTGLLQIDPANNCLRLVYSYNDAGGDLSFTKKD